jgi:mRNA interferase RelE/StbE
VSVQVVARPEVEEDLRALASNELRFEALSLIVRLRKEPRLGLKLEERPGTGDLSDCRKLYFDGARHRIVYRLLPNERRPQTVDVIAVGPRARLAVYVEAVRRLERAVEESEADQE